ncbi:TetR/AcrR family transcriptional regulator [Nitrospirillum amazonense]|uniref:TetR/AcrR family transcriptional regulator n=1 Tax=Nitrospirillum amazonense TaxID=28077 RepID=UPI002DD42DBF|nr:TetR/AcrR family transcriptional regulator [Nitrospirillum amazonense]MEC4593801.1 TetR/AcrR family transcriptional regulator [Nitrospirillum amazonense]
MDDQDTDSRRSQRKTILEATASILRDKGIGSVSVREISKLSKISIGEIYKNFKSKDEIVLECLNFGLKNFAGRVFPDPGKTNISEYIEKEFSTLCQKYFGTNCQLFLEIAAISTRDTKLSMELRGANRKIWQRLVEIIDLGKTRGDITSKILTADIAAFILSSIETSRIMTALYPEVSAESRSNIISRQIQFALTDARGPTDSKNP